MCFQVRTGVQCWRSLCPGPTSSPPTPLRLWEWWACPQLWPMLKTSPIGWESHRSDIQYCRTYTANVRLQSHQRTVVTFWPLEGLGSADRAVVSVIRWSVVRAPAASSLAECVWMLLSPDEQAGSLLVPAKSVWMSLGCYICKCSSSVHQTIYHIPHCIPVLQHISVSHNKKRRHVRVQQTSAFCWLYSQTELHDAGSSY